MNQPTVAVVGTGALAQTVCGALAGLQDVRARVVVAGRSARSAAALAQAVRPSGPVQLTAHPADTDGAAGLADAVAGYRPEVVIQCASWHTTREMTQRRTAWTELLAQGGFGLSLPLQAGPVSLTAAALPAGSVLINGCFPDAVNAVLCGLGLPVLCGLGNVSTLWAHLPDPGVRLLAHHLHLHRPAQPADEARAWQGECPVAGLTGRLSALRALPRAVLNKRAGPPAALLVRHLLSGSEVKMSVPGPLGLPGGYPVVIRDRQLTLDLPAAVSRSAAVAWNQRMSRYDGVVVHSRGRVTFGQCAAANLTRYLPDVAAGFDLDRLPAVAKQMLQLRDRLRRVPARGRHH